MPILATNEIAVATETTTETTKESATESAIETVADREIATGVEISAGTGAGIEFPAAPRIVSFLARPSVTETAGQWKR